MKRSTALKRRTPLRARSPRQVRDKLWELARKLAFELYGHHCQRCWRSSPQVVMQVHHIKPQGSNGKLRYRIENLLPLCRGCHLLVFHGTDARMAAREIERVIPKPRLEMLDRMALMAKQDKKKFDPEAVRLYLEAELEKIQGSPNQPGR